MNSYMRNGGKVPAKKPVDWPAVDWTRRDWELAVVHGVSRPLVSRKRRELGKPAQPKGERNEWTKREDKAPL
jgi:hypothetical protein